MTDSYDAPMSAADAARVAESHPAGGKYRRATDPVTGHTGIDGRHADETSAHGLLLDACAAADLLSQGADSWSAEQILAHPELARLALAEASRNVPTPRSSRLGRKRRTEPDPTTALRVAADAIVAAHSRIAFVDA